jgi:hypothetical protein
MTDLNNYSDLWRGDESRDWAGREYDDCPAPTPEQLEEWHKIAERAREADR